MAKKKQQPAPAASAKNVRNVGPEFTRLNVLWMVALLLTAAEFFYAYRWMRPFIVLGDGRPQIMLIVLAALGIGEFVLSIWLWREIQNDAAKKKDLKLAQTGYFAAWLLCLAIGPLGYVVALSTDGRYYYGFFILAALGVLYHQPARETLSAAAPAVEPAPATDPNPSPEETAAASASPTEPADEAAVNPFPPLDEPAGAVTQQLETEGELDVTTEGSRDHS